MRTGPGQRARSILSAPILVSLVVAVGAAVTARSAEPPCTPQRWALMQFTCPLRGPCETPLEIKSYASLSRCIVAEDVAGWKVVLRASRATDPNTRMNLMLDGGVDWHCLQARIPAPAKRCPKSVADEAAIQTGSESGSMQAGAQEEGARAVGDPPLPHPWVLVQEWIAHPGRYNSRVMGFFLTLYGCAQIAAQYQLSPLPEKGSQWECLYHRAARAASAPSP